MSYETAVKYIVYNLCTYFSFPPQGIKCCPACGSSLSISDIPPSKAVANDLNNFSELITVHDFSHLFKCTNCDWWAVRERWDYREIGSACDYLVVTANYNMEGRNKPALLWEEALQIEDIYANALPLPRALGELFFGGEKRIVSAVKSGDKVRLVADIIIHQPHLIFLGTQGSQGTILDFNECRSEYKELKKRLQNERPAEHESIEYKFWKAKLDLKKGIYYSVRLEIVNPSPANQSQDYEACKKGDIYMVEKSDVEKINQLIPPKMGRQQ